MSNEFGYIPESPAQSWESNKGIFTPNDIYDLTRADKFKNLGQLELIETKTASSSTLDFTSLGNYDIHFFTFQDVAVTTQTEFGFKMSDDGGASFEASYHFANLRGYTSGSFSERKSTSQSSARLLGDLTTATTSRGNGFLYLYHLQDSTKYSFGTSHCTFVQGTDYGFELGGQCYATTSSITALRFGEGTGTTAITTGTISAYGIKVYS